MNQWFTADLHFLDEEIIKYCNRPFKSAIHMTESLIRNWNQRVKQDDLVYHIGDFYHKTNGSSPDILKDIILQLNGQIIFICGNHDSNNGVKTSISNITLQLGGKNLFLQHKPPTNIKEIPINADIVLHGHVHLHWKYKKSVIPFVNVGVDHWKFMPININEIFKFLHKIT